MHVADVACAGDSRAVISQSGKAIDLTRDHKPHEPAERERIESSGGFVCTEGLLNGELGVARAIGDYHLPELKQLDAGGGRSCGQQQMSEAAAGSPAVYGTSLAAASSWGHMSSGAHTVECQHLAEQCSTCSMGL